jgi:PIN domain nuclease of toxin-antitoxin system
MPHPSSHRLELLLDTHALLWWLGESNRLTKRGRQAIVSADRVFVSVASVWEMSLKVARGKLNVPDDLELQLENSRFEVLPVTIKHAFASTKLPKHHGDPFDRMLVAQALSEGLTLVTADGEQAKYGIAVMLL